MSFFEGTGLWQQDKLAKRVTVPFLPDLFAAMSGCNEYLQLVGRDGVISS